MIGRKSVVALTILCAASFCAISASSASAVPAWTCIVFMNGGLTGPHCLDTGSGGYIRFHIPPGLTKTTATNANTASETTAAAGSVLAGSLSGVATELQCTGLEGTGEMENKEIEKEVFLAHGTGTLTYTGCTVLKPAGKGCVVNGGKVTTNELTSTSEGSETLAIKPASGETFASITIEKCTVSALNNTFPVTGSLKATVTGATATTTEAGVTTQGTLKFGGNNAGLAGAATNKGENGNGLVLG